MLTSILFKQRKAPLQKKKLNVKMQWTSDRKKTSQRYREDFPD